MSRQDTESGRCCIFGCCRSLRLRRFRRIRLGRILYFHRSNPRRSKQRICLLNYRRQVRLYMHRSSRRIRCCRTLCHRSLECIHRFLFQDCRHRLYSGTSMFHRSRRRRRFCRRIWHGIGMCRKLYHSFCFLRTFRIVRRIRRFRTLFRHSSACSWDCRDLTVSCPTDLSKNQSSRREFQSRCLSRCLR